MTNTYMLTSELNTLRPGNETLDINLLDFNNASDYSEVGYLQMTEGIVGIIAIIVTSFANGVVLFINIKQWRKPANRNVPRLLLLCLTSTDFMVGILANPFRVISYFNNTWISTEGSCAFFVIAQTSLITLSQCINVMMGIERYASIQKPFSYAKHVTVQHFVVLLIIMVPYPLLMGVGDALTREHDSHHLPCFHWETGRLLSLAWLLSLWIITEKSIFILVLSLANMSVLRAIRALEHKMKVSCPRSKAEYMRQQDLTVGKHRQFSRQVLGNNIVFIICCSPSVVSSRHNQRILTK